MRVKTIYIFINIEQLNEFHHIILFKCFNQVLVLNQLNFIHPFLSSSFPGTDFYSNRFNKVSWKKSKNKKTKKKIPSCDQKNNHILFKPITVHIVQEDYHLIWPTISFFQSQVIRGHLLLIYKYDNHIGDHFV